MLQIWKLCIANVPCRKALCEPSVDKHQVIGAETKGAEKKGGGMLQGCSIVIWPPGVSSKLGDQKMVVATFMCSC